jgi:hypothetical protein
MGVFFTTEDVADIPKPQDEVHMKTKVALKIAKSAEAGTLYPIHVLRAVAMQLQRPLKVKGMTYFPKGLKGDFVVATKYRPYCEVILPANADTSDYRFVSEIDLLPGQHVLESAPGGHIVYVCAEAQRIANAVGVRVKFEFNGATVVARPYVTNPDFLYKSWDIEMQRRRQDYLSSDEYRQYKAEQEANNKRDQAIIDGLLLTLPEAVNDRVTLLKWLRDYTTVADNASLTTQLNNVNMTLKSAGYVAGAYVGQKELIDADKNVHADYIIGQAMSCMDSGLPPHPILISFVNKFFGEEEFQEEEVQEEEV